MRLTIVRYTKVVLKWIRKNPAVVLSIFAFGVIGDIFGFDIYTDTRLAFLLFLYWLYVRLNKIQSRATFLIALIVLAAMFVTFIIQGPSPQTERLAVWVYLMLGFGIIQKWRETDT